MAEKLFDIQSAIKKREVIWVISLALGSIGYGALLMLGITCLVALFHSSRVGRQWSRSEKVLSTHIVLVLLCNTFLQVWWVKSNIKAVFYTDPNHITYFYRDWENVFIVILGMLTDGILVWRCCMVQKALCTGQFTSRWHHICWIFPILLWLVETVTGMLAVALTNPNTPLFDRAESHLPGLNFFVVSLVANFILNTFATLNVVIQLLLHRHSLIAAFGRKNALAEYSLRISSILLESAAINLPLALLLIIGLGIHTDYAKVLTPVITSGQCIASILVIHQVVRGRTILENSQLVAELSLPK